jgi:DNA-binding LacI/PurR family transcriptional regulator
LEGYKSALLHYGIPYDATIIFEGDTRYKGGYNAMKQILTMDTPPTALFAGNDIIAMGAAKAINEAGLSIPDDFSIIGFDGIEHSEFFYPSITTIKVQRYDMGAIAMRVLTKLLNKEEVLEKDYFTEVELIERNSCRGV